MLFIVLAVAGLLLLPGVGYPQLDQESVAAAPPVAQPLVREGTFAKSLVEALNLGPAQNEAEAESLLASAGIAPKNGWIADYPVTPDVLGELHKAVAAAADSDKLPMGKAEALRSLQAAADKFGLPVVAVGPGGSPTPYERQNPAAVNDYYYAYGPPIVTYYPPPPDYLYLYAWVPYPFWFSGYFFTGYFCLHDFDRIIVVNHAARLCTNHVYRRTGGMVIINPAKRDVGRPFRHETAFGSSQIKRGGGMIFDQGLERGHIRLSEPGHVSRGFMSTHPGLSRPAEPFQSQIPSERRYGNFRMDRRDRGRSFVRHGEEEFASSPSAGRRSISPSMARERTPSMRFHRGGPGHFSRGGSFGGFHGGGFGHGGSFRGSR